MARPKAKAPTRQYHMSGQSVVRLDGRDYYLGEHDSPESIARYAVLIATYQAGGMRLPPGFHLNDLEPQVAAMLGMIAEPQQQTKTPITVKHVTACFREFIKQRYAFQPKERHRLNSLCDELDKYEGHLQADEYGPLALQRQRQRWIDSGKMSRPYVNVLSVVNRFSIPMITRTFSQACIGSSNRPRLALGQSCSADTPAREIGRYAGPESGLHPARTQVGPHSDPRPGLPKVTCSYQVYQISQSIPLIAIFVASIILANT